MAGGVFVQGGRCVATDRWGVDSASDTDRDTRRTELGDAEPPPDGETGNGDDTDACETERCNGEDDDCDGEVDEARPCPKSKGVCSGTTATCVDGEYESCESKYGPAYQTDETSADGRDNDCDGVVDDVYVSVTVSGGSDIACGLTTTGAVDCWGDASKFSTDFPVTGDYTDVTAGTDHVCARRRDETLECWGDLNNEGTDKPPTGRYSDVDSGERVACAVEKSTDAVDCWGLDPETPNSNGRVVGIDVPRCQVTTRGDVECWGRRTPPTLEERAPEGSNRDLDAIDVSEDHACARRRSDQSVVCWGKNSTPNAPKPLDTFAIGTVRDQQSNDEVLYGCGIPTGDDSIVCWGYTGVGGTLPASEEGYVDLSVGDADGCAVRKDGAIECWGGTPQR